MPSVRSEKNTGGMYGRGRDTAVQTQSVAPDYILIAIAFILTSIGIIMVFSASGISMSMKVNDATYYLKKDALVAVVALVGMTFTAFFDYRYYQKLSFMMYAAAAVLLIAVLIPGIGKEVNGARRWLSVGMDFQVSDISRLIMIITVATLLANAKEQIKEFKTFAIVLGVAGFLAGLVLIEPDFGMCGLFMVICVAMMFVAGAKPAHLISLLLPAIPALYIILLKEPYRARRLFAFLNPWEDPQGAGYHIIQSLIAIVSGGPFGVGLGMAQSKRFFLPEQHTDFIFSVLVEETGIIGMGLLLFLFGYLGYRGMRIAIKCEDPFGRYIAFGITFMILTQAFINMGVATSMLPITGLTLPFISHGGASLITTHLGIGILVNISMREAVRQKQRHDKLGSGSGGHGRAYLPGRGAGKLR